MAEDSKWYDDPIFQGVSPLEEPVTPEQSSAAVHQPSGSKWYEDPVLTGGGLDNLDTPPMEAPEDNTGASILDNTIALWGNASGALARQLGEALREWFGADKAGRFFEDIGSSAERYWQGSISPEDWDAMQKKASAKFVELKDENGSAFDPTNWEGGDADLESLWYKVIGSGPGMVAGMGAGMGMGAVGMKALQATKWLKGLEKTIKLGKVAGATPEAIKAAKSAERIAKFTTNTVGAVVGGVSEGGISAAQTGSQAREAVQQMPWEELLYKSDYAMDVYEAAMEEGMSPEEAQKHTRDYVGDLVYKEASQRSFLTTAAFGAGAGWALGPIYARSSVAPAFEKGFLRGALKGGVVEMGQEGPQSGFEQYWQNVALKNYADRYIKESEGVFDSVIDGVVVGFAFGTVPGGFEGAANRQQSAVEDQQRNHENTLMFEAHLRMADAALNERGWTEQDRIALFEPIAQELADTGNIVKAVSDLRNIERTGEMRQLGAPQEAQGEAPDIPMAFQYKAGEDRNGITLTRDYGEFPGTVGVDGDPIDFYFGGTGQSNFIIRKRNADGSFQQHKVMVGFETEDEAVAAFYENSDPTYNAFMDATEVDQVGLKDFLDTTTERYKNLKPEQSPDLNAVPDEFLQQAMDAGEDIPFESIPADQKAVFSRAGVVESVTTDEEGAIPYDVVPIRALAAEYEKRRSRVGPPENVPRETQRTPLQQAADKVTEEFQKEEKRVQKETRGHSTEQGGLRGHSMGEVYPYMVVGVGDKWAVQTPDGKIGEKFDTQAEAEAAAAALKQEEEPPMSLAEGERPPLRNPKNIRSLIAHVTPTKEDFESKLTPEERNQALRAVGLNPDEFSAESQKHHALVLWRRADITHDKAKKELKMVRLDGNKPAVTVRFVHQSTTPDLTRLKKSFYRTGASRSRNAGERYWVDDLPKDQQDRVFFNVALNEDPASGERLPAASDSKHLYTGKAENLYDLHADLLRLTQTMTMPKIEAKLRELGYNGILQTDNRGMFGWVWTDLSAAYQGTTRGFLGKRLLQEPTMRKAVVAFETIHGEDSPVYKAMQKLTESEKAEYHNEVLRVIFDSDYREDKLAKLLGAPQRLLQTGRGAWEGTLSPNAAVELNSEAEADFYSNAVRLIFNQDAAGWIRLGNSANTNSVVIEKKGGWSQADLKALANGLPEGIKGFTQLGDSIFITNYDNVPESEFERAVDSATGALKGVRIYSEDIRSNWHDNEKTGRPETFFEISPLAQGSPSKVQWVYDAAKTAQRRTRRFFERLPEDHPARKEYERVKDRWEDIPTYDLRKKENWTDRKLEAARDRIKALNLRAAFEKDYLQELVDRIDWSRINEKVDAASAGAYTREEVQEAVTEWILHGVASKYFKRWFGKSKITDDAGIPLPMYHSTPTELIKEFKSGRRGFMSFAQDQEFANWHQIRRQKGAKGQASFNMVPVYIKAEKVFDYRNSGMRRSLIRHLKKEGSQQEVADLIREQMAKSEVATKGSNRAAGKDLAGIETLSQMIASGSWAVYESPVVLKVLRERGYDGFWMTSWDGSVLNLGVFDTANIKSAIGNLGTFDQTIDDTVYSLRAPDTNEVFVSAIAEWVDTKMGRQMPVTQAIAAFTNLSGKDIKKDEVDDLGLIPWLMELGKGQANVTRGELLQFVRENQIQFREIEYRSPNMGMGLSTFPNRQQMAGLTVAAAEGNIQMIDGEIEEYLRTGGYGEQEIANIMSEYQRSGVQALDDYLGASTVNFIYSKINEAKLDLWQARRYENQVFSDEESLDSLRTRGLSYGALTSYYEAGYQMLDNPTYREFVITVPLQKGQSEPFTSHHWEDGNVIVHMRAWTHVDSQTGEPSLFVEEVQSDWHQQGARYGYNTGLEGSPPTGPMQHTWASLGMRRLIRYAAENGHKRVLWASGEMQRERYDLKKAGVRELELTRNEDGTYTLKVQSRGGPSTIQNQSARSIDKAIGAELADRLLAKMADANSNTATLTGSEVSWSGGAVKAFYDSSSKTGLRYLTDKYIKKYGSHVQVYKDVRVITKNVEVWGFEITDALREKAMAGQSPYSLTDNVSSEMMRRLELYQMRSYLEKNSSANTTNRALRARLMDGAERGFYSKWIVHHSGVMIGKLDRNAMLHQVSMRIASGDLVTQRNALGPHILENEIRHIIANWENPPAFQVHRDYTTLPARLRNKVITHGYQGRIEGTIDPLDGGKVHIIASNIGSIERLHRVFAEEALGHFGLRKVFGEEFIPFLKDVLPSVEGSDAWNNLLEEYPHLKKRIENGTEANVLRAKLLATEELIAKQEVDQTVWQRFVAWFREWLRKHNFITNYTENDIRHVMAKVHSHIMNGDTPHAWGERNFNGMVVRDNGMVFALYGDILKSRLEAKLRDPKFQKKAPPAQYIEYMTGPKFGLADELAYSGIVEWLKEQQKNDPKASVTVEQMLQVFHKNKPRYHVVSRSGRYLFPSLPLSSLVRVGKFDSNEGKDRQLIEKDAGFFGDLLQEFMNNPYANKNSDETQQLLYRLKRYTELGTEGVTRLTRNEITPRLFYEERLVGSPFGDWVGDTEIPTLRALEERGLTSQQIGAIVGVKDFDAPITHDNSNAYIKAWFSNVLKEALDGNEYSYNRTQLWHSIELERYGELGNLGVEYTTDREGNVNSIVGLNSSAHRGRFTPIVADDLLNEMNGLVEQYHRELKAFEAWGDMPVGFVKPNRPNLNDMIAEKLTAYVAKKIEDVTDREDFESIPPEEIIPALPEAGQKVVQLMRGGNSGTGIMEMGTLDSGDIGISYARSQYLGYTMNGGEDYGIITIEMLDPPLGADRIPPYSGPHFGRGVHNILHARMKTRIAPDGGRILAIEEVQSDWASEYNAAVPTEEIQRAWSKKYAPVLAEVLAAADAAFGYKIGRGSADERVHDRLLQYDASLDFDRQTTDFQVTALNCYSTIRKSAILSDSFISTLSKHDPTLGAKLKEAAKEFRNLEKNHTDMPWTRAYHVLALRALTKWAVANDYQYVAWPEGTEVAEIYHDFEQISGKHRALVIDLTTQSVRGIKLREDKVMDFTSMDEVDRTGYVSRSFANLAMGRTGGLPYNLDYLSEILEEGGENGALIKDVMDYVNATLAPDGPTDTPAGLTARMYHHKQDNQLYVILPQERLYNARLHKLLYNRLLVSAAKDMVGYNSKGKWTRGGEEPFGKLFVEDAYNEKKWNKKRNAPELLPSAIIMEGDFWNGRIHKLLSPEMETQINETRDWADRVDPVDIWHARNIQLFGRDGLNLRQSLSYHLMGYQNELEGDERPSRYLSRSNVHTGIDFEDEGESVIDATLDHAWWWDRNRDEAKVRIKPLSVVEVAHHAKVRPGKTSRYNRYLMRVETEDGHIIDVPMLHKHDYPTIGNRDHADFDAGSDGITANPLYLRMMHQLMKSWGIENPAPQRLPGPLLRQLYNSFYTNLELISNDGGPVYDRYHSMMERAWNNSNAFDQSEPEDHQLNWTQFSPEGEDQSGAEWMPVGVNWAKPSPRMLEWLREHATMQTKGDGAMTMAFLLENQDAEEKARIKAMMKPMATNELRSDQDSKTRSIIPYRYTMDENTSDYTRNIWREHYRIMDERDRTPSNNAPVYDVDNPEFPEQVWHAVKLTPEAKEVLEDLPFPLSLRTPRGHDRQFSIINSKIAKSHSDLTVLDRVTLWINAFKEAIHSGDMLWGIKQGLLDDAASVERWERDIFGAIQDASISPYKAMHMTKNLPSVMAAIAKAGIPVMRGGVFQPEGTRKGFIEIFRPLYEHPEGDLMRLWEGYAAARRSNQLIQEVNRDGTSREKLFTQGEINELLALGTQYPELETVFNEWTQFNNDLLNLAVDQGVLSEAERDAWSTYDYVPFYRAMEEIEGVDQRTGWGKVKAGVSGQHHGIKRLHGSEKMLGNVIENMWFNTASLIDKIYKNHAMGRVVDMLEGVAMTEVDMPWEAVRTTNEQLASALSRAGLLSKNQGTALVQVKAMTAEQRRQWNVIFRRVKPTGPNIVSVMRGGKLKYYEVQDENLLRTLNGMGAESMGGIMKAMGLSKSLLTRMITIDPGFMLANWMRDTLSAWVTSDANFAPVIDSIASMKDVWKEDGTFIKMMMSGAGGGGFYDLTGGNVSNVIEEQFSGASGWIPRAWRGYMKLGAMSENSNRLAIANRIERKGGTAAEAMYQAQDIMNFTMSGDWEAVRFLIRTVPFLNARMQGLYRLYRGGRDHPLGFMIKGMALMAASMALLARNWDDDDYDRLEGWQKDTYWNFFVGGVHYTIPKPFEVGLLFGTIPERMMRYLLGKDDLYEIKEAGKRAVGSTLAFNPIPQLFKPMYELGANVNLFTGNQIENVSLQSMEPPQRFSPWTSPLAVRLGEAMPEWMGVARSPVRIEHAIRAYTGTVGLYTLNSVDWIIRQFDDRFPSRPARKWYEAPVLSRVIKGPTETSHYNRYEDRMYRLIDESNKAQGSYNALVRSGQMEEAERFAEKRENLINPNIVKDKDSLFGNYKSDSTKLKQTPRKAILEMQTSLRELSKRQREIMQNRDLSPEEKRSMLDDTNMERRALLDEAKWLIDTLESGN